MTCPKPINRANTGQLVGLSLYFLPLCRLRIQNRWVAWLESVYAGTSCAEYNFIFSLKYNLQKCGDVHIHWVFNFPYEQYSWANCNQKKASLQRVEWCCISWVIQYWTVTHYVLLVLEHFGPFQQFFSLRRLFTEIFVFVFSFVVFDTFRGWEETTVLLS